MIHIACNIDGNYVQHCAVMLVSLFENNPHTEFSVHLVTDGLSCEQKETLSQLCTSRRHGISFYSPDPELLKGFSIKKFSKRISMATYYRCVLADILPSDINRVVYLDCDIVVMGDITPFWNTRIEGLGVAAVEDVGYHERNRYEVLQYPMEYSYFNAGVLLVNLSFWREHGIGRACIEYYHAHPERILFNDQDLLNSVLYKNKVLVGLEWNVQDGFYRNHGRPSEAWKEKYASALLHPIILHYTNRKPWEYDSQHPLRQQYFKYLDLTPWKGWRPWHNWGNRVKRFFRLLPFHIHLRKRKYIRLCDL